MGLYSQKRSTIGFDARSRAAVPFRRHLRSAGERRALVGCGLAATAGVVAAIFWPHWAPVHGAVILCGLWTALYFAPWIDERDTGPQLKFEQRELQPTISPPVENLDRRRAA